jgi:hypothetical protein
MRTEPVPARYSVRTSQGHVMPFSRLDDAMWCFRVHVTRRTYQWIIVKDLHAGRRIASYSPYGEVPE